MGTTIVFLLPFFICFNLAALDISVKHLTIQDGLSQSTINCIYQDYNGFMWFGTQDGLNKYDGYKFNIYKQNPIDTNSISHNWIWNIFQDKYGDLWIATWNGLTRFNPNKNEFTRYFPDSTKNNTISGARPTSICQDDSGNLWIGTWGGGINKYDYESHQFISYKHDPLNKNSLPNNFIRTVYNDKNNLIWVGTWGGLSKIQFTNSKTIVFTNYKNELQNNSSISSDKITSIIRDKSGVLWIGTLGGGLNMFDEESSSFISINTNSENSLSISQNDVSAICEDNRGNLWIGTIGGGLHKFDNTRKKIIQYSHEPDNPASLSSDNVYSIFEDKSGLLWFGSNGLDIYNKNLEKFSHIYRSPNNRNSLNNNKIWAFCEDENQNIWIGTEGGLNKYNPNKNRFYSFTHNQVNPSSISSNNVKAIVTDDLNNLWIGTGGGGLNKLDRKSGKFNVINQSMKLSNTDGIDYIMSLCMDDDFLWIATYDKGLIKYDTKNIIFTNYVSNPDDKYSIAGNYLSTILKDSKGDIWIGGWGAGLCLYNREKDQFRRFLNDPENPHSLVSNIVHSIYEYKNESERTLWVGTNNGLSYLDLNKEDNNSFNQILESDGLPGNVIYGILSDNSNNLWISTNKGLCKFNIKNHTFRNYTQSDGLQSNEFNAASCYKRKNGQLLFGGVNGFNIFFPDSVIDNLFLPPVKITSFKVFDMPYYYDKSKDSNDEILLSYQQNFFSFEFAALDYSQPGKNEYAYQMEGFDRDWIYSGTRRYVSYTNLDPGNYKFKVKATNSDGIWIKNPEIVNIVISPPYWQTIWFRVLILLTIALILYVVYKYRITKLLEIERLRVRIASDLHDDIGSALTRISIHSEIIQNSDEKNIVKSSSKKIGTMSREIITTMGDIVWSIDARNDMIKNLIDRMKDFSTGLLVEKDIQMRFNHSGLDLNKKLPIHIRQNLFLIYKEAINNIYKHSNATKVMIKLNNSSSGFNLKISENGTGFDPDNTKMGNGIKNMKMRAERIGAEFEFISNDDVEVNLRMRNL